MDPEGNGQKGRGGDDFEGENVVFVNGLKARNNTLITFGAYLADPAKETDFYLLNPYLDIQTSISYKEFFSSPLSKT